MVYNIQNRWVCGLLSIVHNSKITRNHNVSDTDAVSITLFSDKVYKVHKPSDSECTNMVQGLTIRFCKGEIYRLPKLSQRRILFYGVNELLAGYLKRLVSGI
jgi:hypothetical protein